MTPPDPLAFECVQCGLRETTEDALVSTCPRCGGEMYNDRRIV